MKAVRSRPGSAEVDASTTRLRGSRESPRVVDRDAIHAAMRPLELTGLSISSTAEHEYFAYYGLDFETRSAEVVHHFGTFPATGFEIACHHFAVPNPRGTCVLLHGYFDHAGLYGHLIEHCLRLRYNVLIWDLPGHGLSSGPQATIHSFEIYTEVLEVALQRYGSLLPQPLYAIGQSTGGAVLMSWAFRQCTSALQCPFARIVLLAPLVRPVGWNWRNHLLYHVLRPFKSGIKREFMENSNAPEFLAFLRADPLQSLVLPVQWIGAMRAWVQAFQNYSPTDFAPVVIQGDADDTVDWRWNIPALQEKFPRARVKMIKEARHQLVNERVDLREQVFAAMEID